MVHQNNAEPQCSINVGTHSLVASFTAREIARSAPRLDAAARWKYGDSRDVVEEEAQRISKKMAKLIDAAGLELAFTEHNGGNHTTMWANQQMIVRTEASSGEISVEVVSTNGGQPLAEALFGKLKKALGSEVGTTGMVPLSASYHNGHCANVLSFKIHAPSWAEIRQNYSESTAGGLGELFHAGASDSTRGRLVVFSGEPGTGKTYAIRATIRELRKAMRLVLVTDPDTFLSKPDYYYSLLDHLDYEKRPLLFIMEDAARPLLAENRVQHNSPVARILNMTDGLLSRTRMDMFLVTFNEDLSELDAAVLRPGRCLARIHFPRLNQEEAAAWLVANKLKERADGPMSLAELYALKSGGQIVAGEGPIAGGMRKAAGFGA